MLFTALIGPHFVDWTSYRESFERQASAYVGQPVRVAGKVGVRLLPTPVVSFTDITVGDTEAPAAKMERFRAEIDLMPLLSGQVHVVQMTMEHPVFRLDIADIAAGRGFFGPRRGPNPEHVSLEHLEIAGGSALITNGPAGRQWRAENIDGVIEADTLMGPAKLEASFALDGAPMQMALSLGRFADGAVATKLSLRSPNYPVALSTDGRLVLTGDAPPKYEGTATVVGAPPADKDAARSPWADFRASGGFELLPTALSVKAMQLSYGAIERPLILEAAGTLDFETEPSFDVTLTARQIDIDRTLGGGAGGQIAIESAIPQLGDMLPGLPTPPIPGRLRFEAQGVVVGGGVVQGVRAGLTTGADSWRVDDFSATLPGETQVDLTGRLGVRPDPTFSGHARVVSRRPAAFAAWWRGEVGSAGEIGRFTLESDVDLRPGEQQLQNLAATTGAGTMNGSLDVRRFPQSGRYFVTVDLSADRADLVQTRALAELFAGKSLAAGKIEQMTLSLSADTLSAGDIEAHSVAVEGGLEDGRFNIRRFSVADLAGADIEAHGSIRDPLGKPSGSIEASIRAENFSGAADFLASLAPEARIARHLRNVAPILSPVVAEVSAEADESGERLSLAMTGSFGATHLSLDADGKGKIDDLASLSGSLKVHADGEDSSAVLRQFGLPALPVQSPPLNLDADFEGAVAEGGKLTVGGTLAGIDVSYDGTTALQDGRPTISGAFKAESADIDPALLLAGIAIPGVGEGHAATAAGQLDYSQRSASVRLDEGSFAGQAVGGALQAAFGPRIKITGALDLANVSLPALTGLAIGTTPGAAAEGWSDAPFAPPLPDNVALDLTLSAAALDIGVPEPATDAKLAFQLADGALQIDLSSATFAGGTLKGALSATLRDGEADLSLRGGLQGGVLDSLVWERSALPVASGMLDASFDLVGRGRSTAAIVAALAGSGTFTIDNGRINALNPEALDAVMQAAEGTREPNEAKARETFASLFGSGALEFGRATGSFAIANGIMTVPTVSLNSGDTAILTDATFDLNRRTLSSQWVVRNEGGADESQPYVQIRFSGPIADPTRQIDLDPLLNLMRSRFVQRQLDQIQVLEAERRRVQAEEAARQAEEERRAEEEAARQVEEERRAAAERRAEEERRAAEERAAPSDPPGTEATPDAVIDPSLLAPPIAIDPSNPEPVQEAPATAPPIELMPEPAPEPAPAVRPAPQPAAPAPTRRTAPPPARSATPTPPLPEYRTLPNGTIVKIR